MLALVNNQSQPRILSLRHILDEYIAFQEQIIIRRTQYDLKKALDLFKEGVLAGEKDCEKAISILLAEQNITGINTPKSFH